MDVTDFSQSIARHRSTKSDTTNMISFSGCKFKDRLPIPPVSATINDHMVQQQQLQQLHQLKEHEEATDFFSLPPNYSETQSQFPTLCSPDSASSLSSNSVSSTSSLPFTLRRIPSHGDSLPARSSPKMRSSLKLALPKGVSLVSAEQADDLVRTSLSQQICNKDGLSNILILDTRSFQDFCKSHINGAINISLPSTLSKRSTFTLEKCVQTLTHDEKLVLQKYISRYPDEQPKVLIYDASSNTESDMSAAVYHLSKKFTTFENWNGPVYVLSNGYQQFDSCYPDLITSGAFASSTNSDMENTSTSSFSDTFSPSINQYNHSPQSLSSNFSANASHSASQNSTARPKKSPLSLSRFMLPDVSNLPFFKSRHNEEVISGDADSNLHLHVILSPNSQNYLPSWLKDIYGNDLGATELNRKFNSLQLQERERLNNALKHTNEAKMLKSPRVSSGFELGSKNRYKDIFPYEHARVKIKPHDSIPRTLKPSFINSKPVEARISNSRYTEKLLANDDSSYINASYLHYPHSKFHYIATQGPLEETVGDFWKVVYDHKVPIIVSLTPQTENYVEKCAPFWEPTRCRSNGVDIIVELVEELDDIELDPTTATPSDKPFTYTKFRHLKVTVGSLPPLHTLQIHITSWPDHGVVVNSEMLLGLVGLKTYIMNELQMIANVEKDRKVVVHCSAGSGRTGCFCCIDTAVDQLLKKKAKNNVNNDTQEFGCEADDEGYESCDSDEAPITPACEFANNIEDRDLIYNITSSFRTQRVAIVQNLNQYILIYDTILKYIQRQKELTDNELLTPRGTIGHFRNGTTFTEDGLVDWECKVKDVNNNEGQFVERFLKSWG